MWWTSRSARPSAIGAATLIVAAMTAPLVAPEPASAVRQGDGPVVLYTRGPVAQQASREEATASARRKGKPANPGKGKPPGEGGNGGSNGKDDPAAGGKDGRAGPAGPLATTPLIPGLGTPPKDVGDQGQVDPISGLGLRNPACDKLHEIRDRLTRLACETNGTPESQYPPTNYGFDTFIDTGIDAPLGNGLSIIVWLLNGIWLGANFILRCVFELLGLGFGLNPFGNGETMRQISGSIGRIYSRITGPWLSTLVVMGGIWFAYKGLVKREVSASVSGTLAAIAMLVLGLWIVHSPGKTVGRVANMSNQVSLGMISAPHTGSISRPLGSFAEAMSETWPRLIEVPFAGLNFSDVSWAMGPPPQEAIEKANEKLCDDVGTEALFEAAKDADGDVETACEEYVQNRYGKPKRVIDLYLRSSPNSPPREALWQYFDKDEGDRFKAKVAAQGGNGVLTRISMLALFLLGLMGALMLLAWLALRLFTQAAIGFVLLLAAPFALFFPLLGDSGRRAFKTWGLTLLGATLAKVIYAAFLSVVLLGITTLGRPGGAIGFLLASAFCWTVFLKRAELVKWLSVGDGDSMRPFSVPSQIAALALGRRVWRTATGAAGGVVGVQQRRGPAARRPPERMPNERKPGERRDHTRRMGIDGLSSSALGVTDRNVLEARQTMAQTQARWGESEWWRSEPVANRAARAEARSPRAARGNRAGPSRAERVRYEQARDVVGNADRETQLRAEQGIVPTRGGLDAEALDRTRRLTDPSGRVRRDGVDRERPERPEDASRQPRRDTEKRVERMRAHDIHLLHAAMEGDPALAHESQMAEEARKRSEEQREGRREGTSHKVRREPRFRQFQPNRRERVSNSRKGLSRGANGRGPDR
jgi:hypothetical protein